jgi:CRP/FNR family transcriptional regulator
MVGLQEAISVRESATALVGGGKRLVATEADLCEIGNLARRVSFPAKSTIVTESEPSVAIYALTRGTACLYKMLADGRRQIVGFALPGDFLGSPFSDRCTCSVDAISEVAARQFLRGPFLASLHAQPGSLNLMLETSLREIDAARNHMLMLGRGPAEEKFVEFIISWRARVGTRGGFEFRATADVPQGYRGFLGTNNRDRFAGGYET